MNVISEKKVEALNRIYIYLKNVSVITLLTCIRQQQLMTDFNTAVCILKGGATVV